MRLIHITDPHLSTLEGWNFASLSGKRRSGYISWTRRRQFIHKPETLHQLTRAVHAENADQIIVTGDLVQIGLEREIEQAAAWLAGLAPADRIFLVPGNHDVYASDSWVAVRRHWNPYLPAVPGTSGDGPRSPYPWVRDFDGLRLIGVSSACVTPVFSARGALGSQQFGRLERLLSESREQGLLCCLAIHHPPLPGMAKWRKALKEIRPMQSLLASYQPAVVWCGHLHHNIDRCEGDTRVFCTASASSLHEASYRVFDIEPGTDGDGGYWDIRQQLKAVASGTDGFRTIDDQRWRAARR